VADREPQEPIGQLFRDVAGLAAETARRVTDAEVNARLLLFARIDFAVRRDGQLTPDEELARALATPWCGPDGCPASVCGGPHTEVILGPGVAVIAPPGTDPESMAGLLQWPPEPVTITLPLSGVTGPNLEAALNYARHVYGQPQEEDPHAGEHAP
jgi:hypothetical protein